MGKDSLFDKILSTEPEGKSEEPGRVLHAGAMRLLGSLGRELRQQEWFYETWRSQGFVLSPSVHDSIGAVKKRVQEIAEFLNNNRTARDTDPISKQLMERSVELLHLLRDLTASGQTEFERFRAFAASRGH